MEDAKQPFLDEEQRQEVRLTASKHLLMEYFVGDNRKTKGEVPSDAVQKLYEKGWLEGLLKQLDTNPVYGISEDAKEMAKRREYYGTNQ